MPVGVPAPTGITVAVSVTDCPFTAGFGAAVTRVIVGEAMMALQAGWSGGPLLATRGCDRGAWRRIRGWGVRAYGVSRRDARLAVPRQM
ncbi:hypothetical protein GCM10009575_074160 [Streptomyces rhizosphaericus]|uniref:Peptidase S1 domain-containing protein n=1 Tax=Streptomyces rhizosphaericus TaxID=114699 RepID=A0ABN1R1S8_9ACTN